jgi:hypothetical protein
MASEWTPPKGYTLTIVPAHTLDVRGFDFAGSDPRRQRAVMLDGTMEVFWFDEDEPFVYQENNGQGQFASQEAKDAAAAGKPMAGWNPKGELRPIQGGYVPDQYVLTADDDKTPKTEPASATARELTPKQEVARLEASIKAAEEQIAAIKKGGSS